MANRLSMAPGDPIVLQIPLEIKSGLILSRDPDKTIDTQRIRDKIEKHDAFTLSGVELAIETDTDTIVMMYVSTGLGTVGLDDLADLVSLFDHSMGGVQARKRDVTVTSADTSQQTLGVSDFVSVSQAQRLGFFD